MPAARRSMTTGRRSSRWWGEQPYRISRIEIRRFRGSAGLSRIKGSRAATPSMRAKRASGIIRRLSSWRVASAPACRQGPVVRGQPRPPRQRIGVAADRQSAAFGPDHFGDDAQQLARLGGEDGRAHAEHGEIGVIDQIDADTLGSIDQAHLAGELEQLLGRLQLGFKLLPDVVHLPGPGAAFLWPAGGITRNGQRLGAGLPGAVGVVVDIGDRRTAKQAAGPRAFLAQLDQRRREIVGNALALLLGGRTQQPQQQEESHHRRDEIGIGDLPRTAMMPAGNDGDFLDDDRRRGLVLAALGGGHGLHIPESGRANFPSRRREGLGVGLSKLVLCRAHP